jgi:excisionase family DNA binding protein
METEKRRILTAKEVAGLLRVTPETVYTWLRTGRLKGERLPGGDWRIKREDVPTLGDGK